MTAAIPDTDELSRLRTELARERQLRLAAEDQARRSTWHVLDEISRKLPLPRRAGADVSTAADATEALAAYARQPFDAVVTDIAMPERDGYELIAHLQQRGPVRALAVSAFRPGEERQRIAASGFGGYVRKSVEAAAFVRAVALFEKEEAE